MTIKGQITAEMPEQGGISKTSGKQWRRKTYVLTYDTYKPDYPKAAVIDVMGDKIDELSLKQGHWYEVEVDFTAREFNGRWYMSATAWKATEVTTATPQSMEVPKNAEELAAVMGLYPEPAPKLPTGSTEDLPF